MSYIWSTTETTMITEILCKSCCIQLIKNAYDVKFLMKPAKSALQRLARLRTFLRARQMAAFYPFRACFGGLRGKWPHMCLLPRI